MSSGEAVILLEGLTFAYAHRQPLLQDFNFQLLPGERVGLVGPNGCGKTTLLHLIVGLLKPQGGTIRILGRVVREEKDFRPVRQQVGLLFQHADDQLFSPTVLEDVAFGPLNQGVPVEEAMDLARGTMAQLDLTGFEDRVTYRLSGGEKKLVALATVLAMRPRVLLLDEPTTGLDEGTKKKLAKILSGLDISYIIVSHEADFLERTTDAIHTMREHGHRLTIFKGKEKFL